MRHWFYTGAMFGIAAHFESSYSASRWALLGVGQPQVRTDAAVRTTTAFSVFTYALLLLALHRCRFAHRPLLPPRLLGDHLRDFLCS